MTVHQGLLWVGCYGDGADHPTLLAFEVDGAIDPVLVAVLSLPDPSFGAFSADGALLHLVGEGSPGSVTTVDVRALLSGEGRPPVVRTTASGGSQPCHLAVAPGGRWLAVANFGDGVVSVLALGPDGVPDGRLESLALPHPAGVTPHAHQVYWLDGNRFLVPDLGGDALHAVAVHPDGRLAWAGSTATPPRSGPRHVAGLTDGGLVLVEELAGAVSWWQPARATDAQSGHNGDSVPRTSGFVRVDAVTFGGSSGGSPQPSGVAVTGYGDQQLVHVAVRGPDMVATLYRAPGAAPAVVSEVPAGGAWPRDLSTGDGVLWVAAQHGGVVCRLRVDAATGLPAPAGAQLPVDRAAWVAWAPRQPS